MVEREDLSQHEVELSRSVWNRYDVFPGSNFIGKIAAEVDQCQETVWLQCMNFENDPSVRPLWKAMVRAAERECDVRLVSDGFCQAVKDEQRLPVFVPAFGKTAVVRQRVKNEERQSLLCQFRESGANFDVVNPMRNAIDLALFLARRNHNKFLLLDDTTFLGGPNFTELITQQAHDFMISTDNPTIKEAIQQLLWRELKGGIEEDLVLICDDQNALYVDSGRGGSLIQRAIIEDMMRARAMKCASQYPPNGDFRLAMRHLHEQGVPMTLVTNTFDRQPKANKLALIREYAVLGKTPGARVLPDQFLHAKTIMFETEEGPVAYIGSHNITNDVTTVLQTQEMMLRTSDPQAVELIERYIDMVTVMSSPVR